MRSPTGPIDAAFIAPLDEEEALYFAAKVRARLTPEGYAWIAGLTAWRLSSAMLSLGYRESDMRARAGDLTITGYPLQSPTT